MRSKNILLAFVIFIAFIILLTFLYRNQNTFFNKKTDTLSPAPATSTISNVYTNNEFGFTLEMTNTWKNYTASNSIAYEGVLVTIRNKDLWNGEGSYADIPILVYPKDKWNTWEESNFENYPSAAPVPPTKRGENNQYVFATAPRYSFAFLTGFEEVEEIIQTLRGFNI